MTLNELLSKSTGILGDSTETPLLDARLIINHVLETNDMLFLLHGGESYGNQQDWDEVLALMRKHHDGLPVAYITGRRAFWRDEFHTRPGVLIPQPDTETLVQGALDVMPPQGEAISLLDLCSGTGCVGISIAKELAKHYKSVALTLSDIDSNALGCLQENVKALITEQGISNIIVNTVQGDLFEPVGSNTFDLIVSNPPYIQTGVANALGPEVKAQGMLALDGGADGLNLIRRIVRGCAAHRRGPLWLLLEIGFDEGPQVKDLFGAAGFANVEVLQDLGGRNRVVKGLLK